MTNNLIRVSNETNLKAYIIKLDVSTTKAITSVSSEWSVDPSSDHSYNKVIKC